MSGTMPDTAMVLAAGLGKRLRPITDTVPKPLVSIAGRTLIDRGLDALAEAGVTRAVVNIHHLGEQVARHLAGRRTPTILVSDERERLLDSAGGIVKALPLLGGSPFFILNADTFWIDTGGSNLARLGRTWDPSRMDILLLVTDPAATTGHDGGTDFRLDAEGRLARARGDPQGVIYAGAAIVDPALFAGASAEPHSLNRYFDIAIGRGRLFGHRLEGHWITVGTPDAIPLAEAAVAEVGAAAS